MKFLTIVCLTGLLVVHTQRALAQTNEDADIQIAFHTDLIKTDNVDLFDKAQLGVEGNYLYKKEFGGTLGIEWWTDDEISVIVGGRYYPVEHAFIRLRAYIGQNDFSLGGGWTQPIWRNWNFEAIGDFYFSVDFAIRAGIVYRL